MSSTESSGSGDLARTLELLWDSGPRPSRGPKPGLTLDRIVEAAIHIADAEGLDAVTMRRVSTELGTGTMTLYRYLGGKGELLDLMLDRVQRPEEDGLPEPESGWRATLEALAYANLALLQRHPWLIQVNQARPVMGPSAVEGMERILTRIKPMGLTDPQLISVVLLIDNYVTGAARTQLYEQEAERRTGLTDREFWDVQAPMLQKAMESGRYPVLAGMAEDTFDPGFDHFGWGLQRLLDGLETVVGRD
ncbi:TetR/AcrR family transcriptional regulator [Nocardia sp. 2]|uniref:TetR/AcrR family transcriptional regulator n=1 Tax=Nocardia acididurans TaxID=2802282 RepID=A0ABS1M6D4_9NOCA|nr:TetR/AcrR family transcriptional regulator [Nocardia acididurans]MBL1075861.1 TetR/AcrR family transcriptional regulator [Nocardia acididurans]